MTMSESDIERLRGKGSEEKELGVYERLTDKWYYRRKEM